MNLIITVAIHIKHVTKSHRKCFDYVVFGVYFFFSVKYHEQHSKSRKINSKNGPSGVVLCLMRIAFFVMIILFVVLILLTGVYYALDLAVQSTCRTAHDDQPFLINLITSKYIFI